MNCLTCKKDFLTKRKDKKYCSRICYRRDPKIANKYSDRTNAYQKLHAKEPKRRYQKLVFKCRHEKRQLDLTYENCIDLWKEGCIYCHSLLDKETGCSLDRLNNDKGYTKDNVVPCCGSCNKIKNIYLTHNEMKIAMTAVLEFRRSNNET